jgi:Tfp pilus assembly protein PilX
MTRIHSRGRQNGAVLFMALIFLVLITVMAVTTFTLSKGTSQVINNISLRRATLQAANQANENAMSTFRIVDTPTAPLYTAPVAAGTGTYGGTLEIDTNGDGKLKIQASMGTQSCFMAQTKPSLGLDMNDPVDEGCANSISTGQQCYNVTFQYQISANEEFNSTTGTNLAKNSISQGVNVTAQPDGARNVCHGAGGLLYF